MKILQIVNTLECGGAEKLVIGLVEKLNKRGLSADILCLGVRGELASEAEQKGIRIFNLDKKGGISLTLIFKLWKVIRNNYDLVHTHNFAPLIYGSIAARLAGVKTINTRHGRARRLAHRYIWQLNSRIISVSKDAETELLKNNCLGRVPVQVVYNAIDMEKFKKKEDRGWMGEKRRELGLIEEAMVVGIVARLSEEKEHGTLLKAIEKIVHSPQSIVHNKQSVVDDRGPWTVDFSKICLLIVGDGPFKEKLIEEVRELAIEDRVRFLGFREDINEILNIIDLFVLSSVTEGVSLTLLEAMAVGKPVVATAVGGNPEVVVHEETGFLVPPKDPEKMADAIMKILNDRELAVKMGENGKERVEEHFSLEHMVGEYEKIYNNVILAK